MPLGKWATPPTVPELRDPGLTWIPAMLEMRPVDHVTIALLMAGLCPQ